MTFRISNRTSLLSLGVTILFTGLVGFVPGSNPTGVAQAQEGFTLASQQGTYASTCTCTANVAASFSVITADGNGTLTPISGIVNVPAPDGSRQVIPMPPTVGTYTINADGTGTATFTTTMPDGSTMISHLDRVITQAEVVGGVKLATEFYAMQQEPCVAGGLVTCVAKRLPDGVVFTNASLQGTYTLVISGGSGLTGAAGLFTADGNGNLAGSWIANLPTPNGSRLVFPVTSVGTYTLNPNGTGTYSGTVTSPNGMTQWSGDIIVTRAEQVGSLTLVTELSAITRAPDPVTGKAATSVSKRLPD